MDKDLRLEPAQAKSVSLEVSGQSLRDLSARAAEPALTGGKAKAKAKGKDDSLFITTNAAFQGAVEGENFQEVLSWARPEPTENLTFRSQWGDALSSKAGKGDWFGKYYKSQYQVYNEEVHGPKPDKSTQNSKEFFSWIKRQQLYYNDILSPEVAEEVDGWMRKAAREENRSLLDLREPAHRDPTSEAIQLDDQGGLHPVQAKLGQAKDIQLGQGEEGQGEAEAAVRPCAIETQDGGGGTDQALRGGPLREGESADQKVFRGQG